MTSTSTVRARRDRPVLGQVNGGKVQHARVFGTEALVALVEHGVDGVGEEKCLRELELVGAHVHRDVDGKGIGTVTEAPQLNRDPL